MPAMASITVKKYDGATDITFDSLTGAGGDGDPAVWRQDTGQAAGFPTGLRSLVKAWGKWNGPKTARLITLEGVFPYAVQDSATTLYKSLDRGFFSGTFTVPQAMPSSAINEFAYQMANLIASTLIKQSLAAGYPPR